MDKYTVGYFTVLTQAQSSKKSNKNKEQRGEGGRESHKEKQVWHKNEEKFQTRQEKHKISKEMRPQRNLLGRIKAL